MNQLNKPIYKKDKNGYKLLKSNFSSDFKANNISKHTSVSSGGDYGTFQTLEGLQTESRKLFGCDATEAN